MSKTILHFLALGYRWKFFNLADYPTKHHPASHHRAMRPTYVLNNILQIFSNPTTTTPVALHHQRKFVPSLPAQNFVLQPPQRIFFKKHPRTPSITNLRNKLVLTCKGVLEPIPANPRRIGTRISPRTQVTTRTTKWHKEASDSSKTIGCKPHINPRACSHPISTLIHKTQLA